jgi:signal transduction histidine kinase
MDESDATAPVLAESPCGVPVPQGGLVLHSEEAWAAAVHQARLEGLYQLAYGLSHEINNPLANITARAQSLLVGESDPQRRRALATIVQQALRAYEMIADLMVVARPPAPRPSWVDVKNVAGRVLEQFQPAAQDQGTCLQLRCPEPLPALWLDETHLGAMLAALLRNALQALRQGGNVWVTIEPGPAPAPEASVRLIVTDDGPGIPDDHQPHLFDPFFSGREAGRGLGLGLCKVWRIAQLYGGRVQVTSTPGQGTQVVVELRQSAPPAGRPDPSAAG